VVVILGIVIGYWKVMNSLLWVLFLGVALVIGLLCSWILFLVIFSVGWFMIVLVSVDLFELFGFISVCFVCCFMLFSFI